MLERLFHLFQRFDLDLDRGHVADGRLCSIERCGDAARRDDVIVLDHHRII